MKYRKIHQVPLHLNSDRNLILRQRWAMRFLELYGQKTWLNIDESWLSESNFQRRKWRMPGELNTVPVGYMAPRISIIVGLDTRGNLYLTLSQANTDSDTIEPFIHLLAAKLDAEQPNWREHYVWLLDNASYHTSAQTMKVFEKLRVPVCFLGPNSYDAAVCELVFAALKTVNLNPAHLPLGKK